ncbi:MAG: hypothetical protein HGB22_05875 [Chlorobiaceae bacterium]|nr:hypothetical protein [Chlorobiaceae bacterium]
MKLIAIIGDDQTRPEVRKLFMAHQVNLFSNVAIRGCSCEVVKTPASWWPSDRDMSIYSSLCFAILDDEKAETIMKELERSPIASDPAFPSRVFMMNVEKML